MHDQAERLRSLVDSHKRSWGQADHALQAGSQLTIAVAAGLSFRATVIEVAGDKLVLEKLVCNDASFDLEPGMQATLLLDNMQLPVQVLQRRYFPSERWICRFASTANARQARLVGVTSGKGGVGKTTLTVNLALAAQAAGFSTVIFDADLGLANVDITLGIIPPYNLGHVLRGEKALAEIVCHGPLGVRVISGGSGLSELANLSEQQQARFIADLMVLDNTADLILLDTGAGLSSNVLNFLYATPEVIVVTTPEPTSIMDAYAVIKLLSRQEGQQIYVLVNRAQSAREAELTYRKVAEASLRFLNFSTHFAGWLPDDRLVVQSIKRQRPFILDYPRSKIAMATDNIMTSMLGENAEVVPVDSGLRSFFTRLARFWSR